MDYQFVRLDGDRLRVEVENVAEAKVALKELKLVKKEYNLAKRSVTEQMTAIRAKYTHDARTRDSMFRGGGGVGRFVRNIQSISRDSRRQTLARELAPWNGGNQISKQ